MKEMSLLELMEWTARNTDRLHIQNNVTVGDHTYYVSTAFTVDHGLETMVFLVRNGEIVWEPIYEGRYQTEEAAIQGHSRTIDLIKNGVLLLSEEEE